MGVVVERIFIQFKLTIFYFIFESTGSDVHYKDTVKARKYLGKLKYVDMIRSKTFFPPFFLFRQFFDSSNMKLQTFIKNTKTFK